MSRSESLDLKAQVITDRVVFYRYLQFFCAAHQKGIKSKELHKLFRQAEALTIRAVRSKESKFASSWLKAMRLIYTVASKINDEGLNEENWDELNRAVKMMDRHEA